MSKLQYRSYPEAVDFMRNRTKIPWHPSMPNHYRGLSTPEDEIAYLQNWADQKRAWEREQDWQNELMGFKASYALNERRGDRVAMDQDRAAISTLEARIADLAKKNRRKQEASADRFSYHLLDPNVKKLEQFLFKEKQNLGSVPYAQYQGKLTADKSRLTSRAEDLEKEYSQTLPFNKQLERLNNFNEQDIGRSLQDRIHSYADERYGKHQANLQDFIAKQFRKGISNEEKEQLQNLSTKKRSENFPLLQERLKELSDVIARNQGRSNLEKRELVLNQNQQAIEDQRKFADLLRSSGNLDTAIANMGLEANKRNFQNQSLVPQREVAYLEKELEPHIQFYKQKEQDNRRALEHANRRKAIIEAGGDDIGAYTSPLSQSNAPTTNLNDIAKAYGLSDLNSFNKSTQEQLPLMKAATKDPKLIELENQLIKLNVKPTANLQYQLDKMINGDSDIASKVISGSRERIQHFDKKAREALEARIRKLGDEYGRKKQYGSRQHMDAVAALTATGENDIEEERYNNLQNMLAGQAEESRFNNKTAMMAAQLAALQDRLMQDQLFHYIAQQQKTATGEFNSAQDELDKQYIEKMSKYDYKWPSIKNDLAKFNITPLNRNNFNYAG